MHFKNLKLPVLYDVDVAIIGGGSAGFASAIAASRTGAKTIIIEKSNSFGGLWTNGLVLRLYGTHAYNDVGKLENYFGGIGKELIEKLKDYHNGIKNFDDDDFEPTPNPEAIINVMDNMIVENNITPLFYSTVFDVNYKDGEITGVAVNSFQGNFAIKAKSFVDCTGDLMVGLLAKDDYRLVNRYNTGLNYLLTGIKDASDEQLYQAASNIGKMADKNTLWMNMGGEKCDINNVTELSKKTIDFRNKQWAQLRALRKITNNDELYIGKSATQLGIRVSRLLTGYHMLEYSETSNGNESDYSIGVSGWANYEPEFKNKYKAYEIPYSIICSRKYSNFFVAGKEVNCDDRVINSLRLVPNCIITGQAAGIAAALIANDKENSSYEFLLKELLKQNCIIKRKK